jgi:gp45 sliding clamp, C terminal
MQNIKLENRTSQIIKNFSSINPSLMFRPGNVLKTQSPTSSVLAIATIDQNFESQFAIYDVARLLGVMSLFKDPELQIDENFLIIKDNNNKRVKYTFADPAAIIAPKADVQVALPETLATIRITTDQLNDVLRAAALLKHPNVALIGRDGEITLSTIDSSGKSKDTYDITVGQTDRTFSIIFILDTMKLIPGDYDVTITKGIVHWRGDRIEYYTGAETNSTF